MSGTNEEKTKIYDIFNDVSRTISNGAWCQAYIEHVVCNDLVPTPKLDVDSYCKAGWAEERYMSNRH